MASPTTGTITPLHAPVVSSRAVPLVVVSTVFQALAVSTIILRFLSKHSNRGVGVDDWVSSRGNKALYPFLYRRWRIGQNHSTIEELGLLESMNPRTITFLITLESDLEFC